MTTKLSEFRKHYLGAFCCQRDVHVNIDVTKATEYWQPCFSKFAFFYKKRFISISAYWIIALDLIEQYLANLF